MLSLRYLTTSKLMEDLELDCLVNIFQRLTLEDLALGVPFVCKSWHQASLDPLCYRMLDFQILDFDPASKFAKRLETQYAQNGFAFSEFLKLAIGRSRGLVVEFKFPPYNVSIDNIVYVSNWCPILKILALPDLMPEDENQILRLVEKWKNLEELEMELKPSCFSELLEQISISCQNFRGLKLSGSIERRDASAIVKFTPNIRYLDLSKSYLRKEELLTIMRGCKEIKRLSVKGCIGFEVDKDLLEMASGIGKFEHEGSKARDCYVYCNVDWDQK